MAFQFSVGDTTAVRCRISQLLLRIVYKCNGYRVPFLFQFLFRIFSMFSAVDIENHVSDDFQFSTRHISANLSQYADVKHKHFTRPYGTVFSTVNVRFVSLIYLAAFHICLNFFYYIPNTKELNQTG